MAKTQIDTKNILEKAKSKTKRRQVSLTFSGSVFDEFQAACEKEGTSVSRTLEALMEAFLENLKKR